MKQIKHLNNMANKIPLYQELDFPKARIIDSNNQELIGFEGYLIENLKQFYSFMTDDILDVLNTPDNINCIGLIDTQNKRSVLWTKYSDFYITIELI